MGVLLMSPYGSAKPNRLAGAHAFVCSDAHMQRFNGVFHVAREIDVVLHGLKEKGLLAIAKFLVVRFTFHGDKFIGMRKTAVGAWFPSGES